MLPHSRIMHGFRMSFKPEFLSIRLLMPLSPHRMGDMTDIDFNTAGNTSTGTHTPPMAESITTDMAATGKA